MRFAQVLGAPIGRSPAICRPTRQNSAAFSWHGRFANPRGEKNVKRNLYWAAALVVWTQAAGANSMQRVMAKLAPEERAHQACIVLGVDKVRKDKALPHADRMKTGVLGDAKFTGTRVTSVGGAVRADHHWYRLTFDCTVTPDQMKATAFTYKLGPEIPRDEWDEIGLWP